tara:strand:- start:2883 stop:3266 length:384 start_codon:yes stop_codon:yes gene_type:complete
MKLKIKRSYRSTKRRIRKNARSVRKTRGQRRRRLQKSRRRSMVRRKRQRGGFQTQTTSVAPNVTMEVTQSNNTAVSEAVNVPTTECTPFVSNSDIFQSTFEPVSSNNVNSVNNYLLLNNNSNYVKMI